MKLFCLPYAGGSACFFTGWQKRMKNPSIHLIPIEYKGHGFRMDEAFYPEYSDMVEDVYEMISREIRDESDKYMIFGHSMGAGVGYEVECLLEQRRTLCCSHVFLSGREAPCYWGQDDDIADLPDEEFLAEIDGYGGTEMDCFEDEEVRDLFLPIIRNDFRLIESIDHTQEYPITKAPVTILRGTEDDCPLEEAEGWRQYTCRSCNILSYEGDHFFLNDHLDEICDYICRCAYRAR